jgi:hypothetical protein
MADDIKLKLKVTGYDLIVPAESDRQRFYHKWQMADNFKRKLKVTG